MEYCVGCGEKKRLRWPQEVPIFCSMRCAANTAWSHYQAGSADFACPVCGDTGCQIVHNEDDEESHQLW